MRLLLILTLVAFGTVSFAAGATSTAASDATVASLSKLSGSAFDVAYLQSVIPEDDEVVEVAYVATHGGDHAELLQWNQRLIERKGIQVRQMLGILQSAGASARRNVGVATPAVKQMRGLGGGALEQAYINYLSKHFNRQVALAQLAMKKTNRPAVKTLAHNIAQVESQEAAMVRGWMKKWYGK